MPANSPRIYIGIRNLVDPQSGLTKEWIVTNEIGGYASSTSLGINTRKYHGLLVASFNPPLDRRVLLSKFEEEMAVEGERRVFKSDDLELVRGGVHQGGDVSLSYFLMNPFPTYEYRFLKSYIQKTIFMIRKRNAAVIVYKVLNPLERRITLRVSPLINSRHFHSVIYRKQINWDFIQKPLAHGVFIEPSNHQSSLILFCSEGRYLVNGQWIHGIYFQAEDWRGESCYNDDFRPGFFEVKVDPREEKTFHIIALGAEGKEEAQHLFASLPAEGLKDVNVLYHPELSHRERLFRWFRNKHGKIPLADWLKWLIQATDQFLVTRRSTNATSVIAGYHWFEDWGRDSLISLPGLTLVTGRYGAARQILSTFKRYFHEGMIPNRFPDLAGDQPVYNTVDATLWYFNAVLQYLKYTGDFTWVKEELWEHLKFSLDKHIQGTLHGIHMDPDCLLSHGPQLTWMDVKIEDRPITPRAGKAVEIQALWYNALKIAELLSEHFEGRGGDRYSSLAAEAKRSFQHKFWDPRQNCLFDVILGEKRDSSLRPNQLIPIMLDFSILEGSRCAQTVEAVWKKLSTPYGIRTLSEDDEKYIGSYLGGRVDRDKAYHNGTVWAWLLGPFITAFLKVKRYQKHWRTYVFETFLRPLFHGEVIQAGLGTISEIFDGNYPHLPRGCISQAWSVAEPLRAYVEEVLMDRAPLENQVISLSQSICSK